MFKGEIIKEEGKNFSVVRYGNKSEIFYWLGKKMCGILCVGVEFIDYKLLFF